MLIRKFMVSNEHYKYLAFDFPLGPLLCRGLGEMLNLRQGLPRFGRIQMTPHARFAMQFRRPIFDQISTQKNLPSLPHILLKLLEACNQDQSNLDEVSEIVHKDPSLSAKILRLVNSAYFGLPRQVEDLRQAVVLVGINGVKNVAICAGVYEAFSKARTNGAFDLKRFWWHSLRCAFLSKCIAEEVKYAQPDEAFLSGLLHDIGKLVLWVNFRKAYEELLTSSKGRPDLLLEGETRLGATHCEVAAWLLDRWHLQSEVLDPVLYHHEPVSRIANALPLVQIVYVAHALCMDPAPESEDGSEIAEKILGLEEDQVNGYLAQADLAASEVARSLGIEIDISSKSTTVTAEKDFKKKEALVKEVRDVSLLAGTLQGFLQAEEQDDILKVLLQGLQVLFDLKNVMFFIHDPDRKVLIGKSPKMEGGFSVHHGLAIALKLKTSLLIRALENRKALTSFRTSGGVVPEIMDEQIIRFLGREGMFCLPMLAQGEPVGVLAIGLGRADLTHLSKNARLLNVFVQNGAMALRLEYMRRSRLQTIRTERLGASSAIARKVVHEVNNPLGIIKNYLKILGMKLSEKKIAQEEIRIISEEIDRVAQILRGLSDFSTEKPPKKESVDINSLLLDILKITRESLVRDTKVEIQLDLEHSLPAVIGEKNGLKQVFINLIKNAAEAMQGGGNLNIQTRYVPGAPVGQISVNDGEGRGYVEIVFNDNGPGIPEDIKEKLFEPFVGSKGGSHSGLGLSVAHNIITSLNGNITCESQLNKGTEFKIELPVSSELEP